MVQGFGFRGLGLEVKVLGSWGMQSLPFNPKSHGNPHHKPVLKDKEG